MAVTKNKEEIKFTSKPFLNQHEMLLRLLEINECPTSGVNPIVMPIPKSIPIMKIFKENEAAASSVVPRCPTIILSKTFTVT